MAKKTVATLKTGEGQAFTKVIKMVRSQKSGSYLFKEEIIDKQDTKDFFEKK